MLEDLSPMPFGKYKGTPMQDVPAAYLHYLWTQCKFDTFGSESRKTATSKHHHDSCDVSDYIRTSIDALKKEDPDRIW